MLLYPLSGFWSSPLIGQQIKKDQWTFWIRDKGKELKFNILVTCYCVIICLCACLTQAMTHNRNCPVEFWVSLFEEGVQPVDLWGHCVYYGLAIGGAVIEKQVEQSVVGKMSQSADTGQSDPLDVPGEWVKKEKKLSELHNFLQQLEARKYCTT